MIAVKQVLKRRKTWVLMVVGLFFILQVQALLFHGGKGLMRYTTRIIIPPAYVAGRIISYHRTVETAHAFVALGFHASYKEAFPAALAFILRDARLRAMGGEITNTARSETVFSQAQEDALRAANISAREQTKYLRDPLARLRSATVLRDDMRPSQDMRLANIHDKLDLGMPFADVARYFSEDQSAADGGDLGIIFMSELPSWLDAVREMEAGEVRGDFVGSDAFWIIKKGETGTEEGWEWVHVYGIAINKPSIGALLRAHAETYPAWIFVW